jgi:uncharacterized protein
MDKRTALKLTKQYVKNLKRKYDVKKAYLFGSFARGNAHEDSDIDVAVVLGGNFKFHETQLDLMRMRWDLDTRIEPHPIHEKDFNKDFSFAYEILKYGIPIKV